MSVGFVAVYAEHTSVPDGFPSLRVAALDADPFFRIGEPTSTALQVGIPSVRDLPGAATLPSWQVV